MKRPSTHDHDGAVDQGFSAATDEQSTVASETMYSQCGIPSPSGHFDVQDPVTRRIIARVEKSKYSDTDQIVSYIIEISHLRTGHLREIEIISFENRRHPWKTYDCPPSGSSYGNAPF
jgi:hypothetical protein